MEAMTSRGRWGNVETQQEWLEGLVQRERVGERRAERLSGRHDQEEDESRGFMQDARQRGEGWTELCGWR